MSYLQIKYTDNTYKLYDGDEFVFDFGEKLGISYSYWVDEDGNDRGFVTKYGNPVDVLNHHAVSLKALSDANSSEGKEISDNMYYTEGVFDIEDIQKCLDISDYITKLHKADKLLSIPFILDQLRHEPSQKVLYTYCKTLREQGVSSDDISKAFIIAIDNMSLTDLCIENIEEILDALSGWCHSSCSLK